jgi:hypothetical protein
LVKERLRRTRRSGRMPVRRCNGQRTNCKPHVLEAESLYGIQCVGYQFAGQSGEERGSHRQRGRAEPSSEPGEHHEDVVDRHTHLTPLASAQRGWLGRGKLRKSTAQHLNDRPRQDAKDGPGAQIAQIAHIPPSSNRRPIFKTPKSTLCLCACVCEKVRGPNGQ